MAVKKKKLSRKEAPPTKAPSGFKKIDPKYGIKKGEVRNPTGNNKPKAVRAMEALTEKTLQDTIQLILTATKQEMRDALLNPGISLAQEILIKTALKASKDSSFHQLNEILNRAIGTVKQKIDHTSEDGSMSPGTSTVQFYLPENKREETK